MSDSLLAFLGIAILVIVTPGPDTALTIRNALLGGRRGGIATAFGVSTGQVIWALATSAGLVALLLASEPVFQAIKLAGAAYLVYLGVHAIRSALVPAVEAGDAPAVRRGGLTAVAAFRQGVINDLGNPKMAVFFASVLPQFAPEGQGMFSALVLLGVLFAALTFAWLAIYAAVIAQAGAFLRRSAVRRSIEGVTGTVLVALGIRVAADAR